MIRTNTKIKLATYSAITAANILLLASCGSSGGGSSIPSEPIAITSSNSEKIISDSGDAVDKPEEAKNRISTSNSNATSTRSQSALSRSFANIKKENSFNIAPLATTDCPDGGSYTTPDDSGGIGDYIFDNCRFGESYANGSISITGTGSLYGPSFQGTYSYNYLTFTGANSKVVFDGSMNLTWDTVGAEYTLTYDVPLLTYKWTLDGEKGGMEIVDYTLDYYQSTDINLRTMDYGYTVNSTALGGSIHMETTQTLEFTMDSDYPTAGQVTWSGANNTSARLTVAEGSTGLATDNVLVEVDADGDGVYEESKTLQWQELEV
jgi:hypothetical protein